jgi:hypothetical protein
MNVANTDFPSWQLDHCAIISDIIVKVPQRQRVGAARGYDFSGRFTDSIDLLTAFGFGVIFLKDLLKSAGKCG